MLFRIEVRNNCATVSAHKMERGWRDIPHLLLKRGQYVKDQPELIGRRPVNHRHADRRDETRAIAIGNELLETLLRLRLRQRRLSACGFYGTDRGCRGAGFQESPSTSFFSKPLFLLRSFRYALANTPRFEMSDFSSSS